MPFDNVAPGFYDLQDVAERRVSEIDVEQIVAAVELSARLHTQAVNEMEASFVERGTEFKERYYLPVVAELQPLVGDTDRPRPVKGHAFYDRAYPLKDAGHAWGGGRKTRAKMTVAEANDLTLAGLLADTRWRMRHILSAWLTNAEWTYEDPLHGDLTVGALANGDAVRYVDVNGDGFTDNHYLAQADPIDETHDPFPLLIDELAEHPENDNDMTPVAYIPTNLVPAVAALPKVYNRLPAELQEGANATRLVTEQTGSPIGEKVIGFHEDGLWLVEWKRLPANYIPFHVPGIRFLFMREEPEAVLQGLRPEFYDDDGVTWVSALIRTAGYAARNRIAAGVLQIGAASYTAPAAFMAPLPQ